MPNRLAHEKSPYLLQHADNPVDWYPWGDEALMRARQEKKPILVSIGYSACHWCHVMAHECFEDPLVAKLMNTDFINIKVDREERPDVDSIYMEAIQAMTGHGGWPLNAFLTPDGRPFYGGTYFPPQPRHGLPSWTQVLAGVAEAYRERHDEVVHNATQMTAYLREAQQRTPPNGELTADILTSASRGLLSQIDQEHGGFGGAPKFPQPLALEFMLRTYYRSGDVTALDFVIHTLRTMAAGGIHDQLGGGFHRYAVDDIWLVPHFEKMLYDNALLARVYLQAFQITGDPAFRLVVETTLDYLTRDLLSPEGAFYAAEDADSEGVEGKFYLWSPAEVEAVLGDEMAQLVAFRFGVTQRGNFEGATILTQDRSADDIATATGIRLETVLNTLRDACTRLREVRDLRVRPGCDTKILAGWNALAIRSLAEAGRVLARPDYLATAERAMHFVWTAMRPDGRLVRSYLEGPSAIHGFLEDYAYLVEALTVLYETTYRPEYLHRAESLIDEMVKNFWDEEHHTFFDAREDAGLVVRPRNAYDNPIPSGGSSAAFGLLRLAALTDRSDYRDRALGVFHAVRDLLPRAPQAFPYLLCALDFYFGSTTQIAIVVKPESSPDALTATVFSRFLPNKVLAVGHGAYPLLLAGRDEIDSQATAYVCESFACRLPVTDAGELSAQLSVNI